jgi:hypothetical protein
MVQTIKLKVFIYFMLIHTGLGLGLYGWRQAGSPAFLLWGLGVMYAAFVFSAVSIYWPLRPWLKRAHTLKNWRSWILYELPTILAIIPILIQAMHILRGAWKELKTHHENGELNATHLSTIAQKVAEQTEELAKEPKVEQLKSKLTKKTVA